MRSTRASPASTDLPISSAAAARPWSPTAASSSHPFAPAAVVGFGPLPVVVDVADGCGADVARGRDAACRALPQTIEQEDLGAREHLEAGIGGEDRCRVAPVARGVLQAHDNVGKLLDEAANEG